MADLRPDPVLEAHDHATDDHGFTCSCGATLPPGAECGTRETRDPALRPDLDGPAEWDGTQRVRLGGVA